MSVYEAAQQFLEARQQVRQTRQQQDDARLTLQQARAALGQAFAQASDEVVGNALNADEAQLFGLSSFAICNDGTCTMLVFSGGSLQTVIEGPILAPPPSSP